MADGRGSSRTIGYIVAAIIVVLLLAWLLGLFGAAEVEGDAAVVTEEGAAAGEAAEEAVEDAAEEAEDAAD